MKRPRLLILGGSGQLGQAIQEHACAARYEIDAPTSDSVDVRDAPRLMEFVHESAPAFAINCAAYTAVDQAESEPDVARSINGTAVGDIARACARSGARLIHLSTDYVFDGDAMRPYRESDAPRPINAYGASKLVGEQLAAEALPQSCILRVSGLFTHAPSSFVAKIVERARRGGGLRVVGDQLSCPTSADGVADVLFRLIEAPRWCAGVFHYCGSPATTWFGFANEIVTRAVELGVLEAETPIVEITSSELGATARRPRYSVLDASALTSRLGVETDAWRERLGKVLGLIASAGRR